MTIVKIKSKLFFLIGMILVEPAFSEGLGEECAVNENGLIDIALCVSAFKKKNHVSQIKLVNDLNVKLEEAKDSIKTLTASAEKDVVNKKIATLSFLKDIVEPQVECKKGFSYVSSAVSSHIYSTLSANNIEAMHDEVSSYIGGCVEKIPNLLPTKIEDAKKVIESTLR